MIRNFFSVFSHRTTAIIGMALLNAIYLQMFQKEIKISPLVRLVSLSEHL